MKKILLTIIALALVAVGCNRTPMTQRVNNPPESPVVVDPKWQPYGISFESPAGWELQFTVPDEALRDKALKDGYDGFSLQEVITARDASENLLMDFYRLHSTLEYHPIEEQLAKLPCQGDVTPCTELVNSNGLKYKTYISSPADEGLYHTQVIFPTGKYIYEIFDMGQPTLAKETAAEGAYKNYMDQFWQVINSIKLQK